ncbi:uncharacterized protein TrAtP1_010190 [Trichoderma atroviride]|uniref:uncharacterized protein n=1 Tax=Hypocrea atroviridis TaxID=63577 RepID=UPI00331916F9|nr:hypothetical protein TrAtP1_010190 [Trichoderma atroviride]
MDDLLGMTTSRYSDLSYSAPTPNALLHQPRIGTAVSKSHLSKAPSIFPRPSQTASRRLGRVTRPAVPPDMRPCNRNSWWQSPTV